MTQEKSDIDLFIEAISKDEAALLALKNIVVNSGHYDLAQKVHKIIVELYPRTDEHEKAEGIAKAMSNVLAIMGTQVTQQTAYRIYLVALAVKKKGNKVKIDEISDIIHESKTLIR